MRKERKLFLEKRRRIYRGRFHDFTLPSGESVTRDLASEEEVLYKIVSGRRRKRSEREIGRILQELYTAALLALESGESGRKSNKRMVRETIQEWLDGIAVSRSAGTVKGYAEALSYFLSAIGNFELENPPAGMSGKLLAYLRKRGLNPASTNSRVQAVQVFFNYCEREDFLKRRVRLEKMRLTKKAPGIYTEAQLDDLLASIEQRVFNAESEVTLVSALNQRRAFYMLRYTGMRGGEVRAMPLERILQTSIIIADVPEAGFKVKGRKEARVPVMPALREFLDKDLLNRNPAEIWYLDSGQGSLHWSSVMTLGRVFRTHIRSLGITDVKPLHGFRATVASSLLNSGTSPQAVQALLRHSSVTTTMGYFNPDRESLWAQIEGKL